MYRTVRYRTASLEKRKKSTYSCVEYGSTVLVQCTDEQKICTGQLYGTLVPGFVQNSPRFTQILCNDNRNLLSYYY